MANLPPPLNLKAAPFEVSGGSAAVAAAANKDRRMQSAEQLVLDLCNPDLRENALLELSKVSCSMCIFLVSVDFYEYEFFTCKCTEFELPAASVSGPFSV